MAQMSDALIGDFVRGIDRVLVPSGHLFLWVDKFHLCQGVRPWLEGTSLEIVDLMTWDKGTFGMVVTAPDAVRNIASSCKGGPVRAKGVWKVHNITDVVLEKVSKREHPHAKPVELQGRLISAVSSEGDFVH